jgi:GNAT superfamily N-acetyltransferase
MSPGFSIGGTMDESAIRPLCADDASEIARLSGELGYPSTPDQVAARMAAIAKYQGTAFVADAGSHLEGFVHVEVRAHLESDLFAEISGLVVDARARSRGVGARLVARAETWAREQGMVLMRVRSNMLREHAHRFYDREVYGREKTSVVFTKSLRPSSSFRR